MSDAQLTALLGCLSSAVALLVGVLRWSVIRITKALDDNTASHREDAAAKVILAEKMAVLATKIDSVSDFVEEHTPVQVPVPHKRSNTPRAITGTTYLEVKKTK